MEADIQNLDDKYIDSKILYDDANQIIDKIKSKISNDEDRKRYKAFYSSELRCITTNQEFMCVNICEKAISRGYFVCARIQVRNNIVYLNEKHSELIEDAVTVGLKSPFDQNKISKLVHALHKASCLSDCEIIIYVTAGIGDQGIYISPENTAVYGVAIEIEQKPKFIKLIEKQSDFVNMATVKNTNYLSNSYAATTSKAKGGYLGVMLDKDGYLLEASMANAGVVLKSGKLIIPSFERTLAGTTAISYDVQISDTAGPVALSFQQYLDEKETGAIEKVDLTPISKI